MNLLPILTDCFFLLRCHRNNANTIRHYEPACGKGREERRSNFSLCAIIFLLVLSSPIQSHKSFAQPSGEAIKIGFLVRDKNDLGALRAAELAIQVTNARGGYLGQKFELVTRSCDGSWGMTSKQTVALIYDDEVPIVVTALDGRNAHLAEQVTAKSHVVMLSTSSSDPTLSRAYVPWYFRIVPDDKQQAEALVKQIYQKDKAKRVAVISFDNYDGKLSAEAFVEKAREKGFPNPEVWVELNEKELREKINANLLDAVVLAGTSINPRAFIQQIDGLKIYAFLNTFNFNNEISSLGSKHPRFTVPGEFNLLRYRDFLKSFQTEFNEMPSISSIYIYDGIMLAIEAIKRLGPDPNAIRKGFKDLKCDGITGNIEFSELGNREIGLTVE